MYLRQCRKNVSKKQDQKLHTKNNRNILLFNENHTNTYVFKLLTKKLSKNKRHTPRGRRTCHLVVVIVVVVVVVAAVAVAVAVVVAVAVAVAVGGAAVAVAVVVDVMVLDLVCLWW